MNARVRAIRGLCLGMVAAGLTAGLGAMSAPAAHAALPGPDSSSWIAVKRAGTTLTDGAGDFAPTHLDLTAAGGTLGPATAFVAADLVHASFRFHVAALPAGAAGGYVVQFDTDANTAGWERALRYDPAASTVTFFTAGPNAGVTVAGTVGTTVPTTAATAASYAGADGGAYVAFAVSRAALTSAGITPGAPMVIGTTNGASAALDLGQLSGLVSPVMADVLGTPVYGGLGAPAWSTLVTDQQDFDSDGDGFIDRIDNCPVVANPGQEDDDKAIDNSLPPGTRGVPDGTEGRGNACDATPRGYDLDHDDVGLLDDLCGEQYGLDPDGCPAQSTTRATLGYAPKAKRFKGTVRADYDQCVPRRAVTVFRQVRGPDRQIGSVKTDNAGRYAVAVSRRPGKGTYYALVDAKWTLGARCFFVKSPKLKIG